jgi:hypothetical protein
VHALPFGYERISGDPRTTLIAAGRTSLLTFGASINVGTTASRCTAARVWGCGQGEDALQDAGDHAAGRVAAVLFQVESQNQPQVSCPQCLVAAVMSFRHH